jgi:hypothetical protein
VSMACSRFACGRLTRLGDILSDADRLAIERDIEDTLRVEPLQQVRDKLSSCGSASTIRVSLCDSPLKLAWTMAMSVADASF